MAMARSAAEVVADLATTELDAQGFLARASNHTLLCFAGPRRNGLAVVYKPRAGERPLRDFPAGTLCQREVAAYEVDAFLGWGLVPPTVLRDGPMGIGSVQLFVPHDPREHYFTFIEDPAARGQLVRVAVFDLLVNNADRKGSHIVRSEEDGTLRGIDHGLTFHVAPKLRTVIWNLGPAPVPPVAREDAGRLADALAAGDAVVERLGHLLDEDEIEVLRRRAVAVADLEVLPDLPEDARPYPWPPL